MEFAVHEAQSSTCSQNHRIEGGACFHCGKQGHWAKACPYNSPNRKPSLIDSPDFPHIQCPCGGGTCVIRTSRTSRNPGRKFYSCPLEKGSSCDFFKWCDMVTDHEISRSPQSPPSPAPMCSCGAGICRISVEEKGPNAGRRSFVCPVKKGQGACTFFQWEDAQVNAKVNDIDETNQCSTHQSAGISQQDTGTGKSCSVKEGALSFQYLERVEDSPVKESSCPSNPKSVLGPSEKCDMLPMENGEHDEASKFHSLKLHNAAGVTSLEGIFPSYDPIFVPPDFESYVECSGHLSQSPSDMWLLTPGQDVQILDVLLEPSGLKNPPNTLSGNTAISKSIWEAFGQAALHVQNKLLTLLESLDPLDHESMVREANSAFAGLDRLGIDYRPFYERVQKFIGCASTLAHIESTIRNDPSQWLMDSYNSKRSHYENIARLHSKAMPILTSSNDHLHFLHKEAIRVKEMLLQIETQLFCCEVETAVLETHLLQVSQDMLQSKQNVEDMYKEAAPAIQLQQQRGAKQSAAKEAMERARVQLRR